MSSQAYWTGDVLIVGAGWSGMLMAKYCKSLGLTVRMLEKSAAIGGVWVYNEKQPGGVMASTQTTSSWSFTEISDCACLVEEGLNADFPRHDIVLRYLQKFARVNNLEEHCSFNCEAKRIQKLSGKFHTEGSDGNVYVSDRIVMSTGQLGNPRSKGFEELTKDFTGEVRHANTYKRIKEEHYGKNILVIGGGETASDLCNEISYAAENVYLSIPNGQWFGGRFNQHWDYATAWPLDNFSSRLRRNILDGNPDPEKFEAMKVWAERYDGKSGHGYECWKSPFDTYGQAIINKSNDVLRRCVLGRVTPKGKMKSMSGRSVKFVDGTEIHDIDMIYFATGYAMYFPMLKDLKREHQCITTLYKFCMDCQDESIGFVGFCRPIRGSFPSLSESCARLLSHSWAGKIPIPPSYERERICRLDRLNRDMFFTGFDKYGYTMKCPSSGGVYRANFRAAGLVDLFFFNDEIAKIVGVYPDYWRILTECGLYKFYLCMFAPYHQGQFLLNDPSKREYVFSRYEYFMSRFPVFIPIIFSIFQGFFQNWKAYLRNRFYWTLGYLFVRKPHAGAIHIYDYKAAYNRTKAALSVPGALKDEWPPADGIPICKAGNEFCDNLTRIATGDAEVTNTGCGASCNSSCSTKAVTENTTTKLCPMCGELKGKACKCAVNATNRSLKKGICDACGAFSNQCVCHRMVVDEDDEDESNPESVAKSPSRSSTPSKRGRSGTPSKSKRPASPNGSPSPAKSTAARKRR